MLAAMQIGEAKKVTLSNLQETVTFVSESGHDRFDDAILDITGKPLSKNAFWRWKSKVFTPRPLFPSLFRGNNLVMI
jgi:hypothetical protein